jgi:hypothetical protein
MSPRDIPWYVRAARATLQCDRRILYAVFAGVIVLLVLRVVQLRMPVPAAPGVQRYFDTVESVPTDKLVIIDVDWGAAQLSEQGGQLDCTLRHLFARHVRVALLTWIGAVEQQEYIRRFSVEVSGQMGKQYGVDYIVFTPLAGTGGPVLSALAKDVPGTVRTDGRLGKPIESYPIMQGVRSIQDVGLIVRLAYQWDIMPWIGFVEGPYGTKLNIGAAAITSSTAYSFLDTKQISGLLDGASGAAQYEQLVTRKYGKLGRAGLPRGEEAVQLQSFAAGFVILAIILGNVALIIDRVYRRREGRVREGP